MYFASLHDLFYMNGHGVYVWASYGIGFITLAALVWLPFARHRKLQNHIRRNITLSSPSVSATR